MGGFAIDLDAADDSLASLFGDYRRLTLTARGLALLAECGHVPEISAHEIRDKNKADGLAKLLVCIQAGWMIVQVTSRSATGLATTLLEVHTVAHVVCALVMYVIWWHKPRQVVSPTLLKGDSLGPLMMYMFLASRMSGATHQGRRVSLKARYPSFEHLHISVTRASVLITLITGASRVASEGLFDCEGTTMSQPRQWRKRISAQNDGS